MGYTNVISLRTGLRGWNDYEQPLVDNDNAQVALEIADDYFASKVKPDQQRPK